LKGVKKNKRLFESPSPYAPPLKGGEIMKEPPIEEGKLWMVPTEKSEEP
jgi:hypothetical protein